IMFGGVDWSGRSTNATTLSLTRTSLHRRSGTNKSRRLMRRSACVKERQNSCDDKSAETPLNLIQIKDVNLKCITDASLLAAAEVTSVIPVLSQYTSIGCNPGKHPDTRTMAIGLDDASRDNGHDRCLCIERPPRYESRDRRRAH